MSSRNTGTFDNVPRPSNRAGNPLPAPGWSLTSTKRFFRPMTPFEKPLRSCKKSRRSLMGSQSNDGARFRPLHREVLAIPWKILSWTWKGASLVSRSPSGSESALNSMTTRLFDDCRGLSRLYEESSTFQRYFPSRLKTDIIDFETQVREFYSDVWVSVQVLLRSDQSSLFS